MGALSVPRGKNAVLFRESAAADVLLLRLPRGWKRHHVCDGNGTFGFYGSGQAAGRAGAHGGAGAYAQQGGRGKQITQGAALRGEPSVRALFSRTALEKGKRADSGISARAGAERQHHPRLRPWRNAAAERWRDAGDARTWVYGRRAGERGNLRAAGRPRV